MADTSRLEESEVMLTKPSLLSVNLLITERAVLISLQLTLTDI